MTEGYIIIKQLKNNTIRVISSNHFKKNISRKWQAAQRDNPDAKMVLLKCTRIDSFNLTRKEKE